MDKDKDQDYEIESNKIKYSFSELRRLYEEKEIMRELNKEIYDK